MNHFKLDPRLEGDTIKIADLDTCELRLMDDSRWPWLILVPRLEGAVEWHELFTDQRQDIDFEISNVASILKSLTGCQKINIASLGNVVSQLHIHIVARNEGDPNWPAPVWGFGEKVAYKPEQSAQLIETIQEQLGV